MGSSLKTIVNNNIVNNSIYIHYTILQAKDKSCLLKALTENSFKNINSFNIDSNTLEESLNLFICFIGKSLYFEGCNFSHEIEHAYQHFCKKNTIKDYNPTIKDKTIYNKFFDLMNSSDNIEKYIGIIGYLSTYSEQDAFVQGLVEELDGVTGSEVYIKYGKSETRITLNNYQKSIQLLLKKYNDKELKEKIDNICSSCGMTFNSFIKNGQVGLKRFEGKIGKVLKHFFESNKAIFEKIDE